MMTKYPRASLGPMEYRLLPLMVRCLRKGNHPQKTELHQLKIRTNPIWEGSGKNHRSLKSKNRRTFLIN